MSFSLFFKKREKEKMYKNNNMTTTINLEKNEIETVIEVSDIQTFYYIEECGTQENLKQTILSKNL